MKKKQTTLSTNKLAKEAISNQIMVIRRLQGKIEKEQRRLQKLRLEFLKK